MCFNICFASLVGVHKGIKSFAITRKSYVITGGIKKYKSTILKNKKKHDKIVLLTKSKLNSIEALTSKVFSDSNLSHNEFVLTNNVLKELFVLKKKLQFPTANKTLSDMWDNVILLFAV